MSGSDRIGWFLLGCGGQGPPRPRHRTVPGAARAAVAAHRIRMEKRVTGFWTQYGFWQIMPPDDEQTRRIQEPADTMTTEDQILAAIKYIKTRYGNPDE